jgi:hypothetical protein
VPPAQEDPAQRNAAARRGLLTAFKAAKSSIDTFEKMASSMTLEDGEKQPVALCMMVDSRGNVTLALSSATGVAYDSAIPLDEVAEWVVQLVDGAKRGGAVQVDSINTRVESAPLTVSKPELKARLVSALETEL